MGVSGQRCLEDVGLHIFVIYCIFEDADALNFVLPKFLVKRADTLKDNLGLFARHTFGLGDLSHNNSDEDGNRSCCDLINLYLRVNVLQQFG